MNQLLVWKIQPFSQFPFAKIQDSQIQISEKFKNFEATDSKGFLLNAMLRETLVWVGNTVVVVVWSSLLHGYLSTGQRCPMWTTLVSGFPYLISKIIA